MPRKLVGGLIQAAAPITDPSAPIDKVRKAAIDAHIPFIEEAGRRGVQVLGLQEVFNGPYFCPSQDAHWYDIAEAVLYFASPRRAAKSTGNILNVDGGVALAYPR